MKYFLFVIFVNVFVGLSKFTDCQELKTPKLIWNGDKGYYIEIYNKMNWFSAYEFCKYNGMELLTLETIEEQNYIINAIKSLGYKGNYWTSANNLGDNTFYTWMSTGGRIANKSPLWAPNQPDDLGNCASLHEKSDFKLNDSKCYDELNFICETGDCKM